MFDQNASAGKPPQGRSGSRAPRVRWSLRKKLIGSFIVAAWIPLGAFAWFSMDLFDKSLLETQRARLVSLANEKKDRIKTYLGDIEKQVITLSETPLVLDALKQFSAAFPEVEKEAAVLYGQEEENRLLQRYRDQQERTPGASDEDIARWFPGEKVSLILQSLYISENPHPIGEKGRLDAADYSTAYSKAHQTFHPSLRAFLSLTGAGDLFLVAAETGHIVYSVNKKTDFATSLTKGPYAQTGVGRAFQAARSANEQGRVTLVDFEPYSPAFNESTAFMAAPIFEEGKNIGVLLVQIPLSRIETVVTSKGEWSEAGWGETGEVYLVGSDRKMRTRSLVLREPDRSREIQTPGVREVLEGRTGFGIFPGYLGRDVLSAYAPVEAGGMRWGLLAEIARAEALGPQFIQRNLGAASGAAGLVLSLFLAFFLSKKWTRPVLKLVAYAVDISRGNLGQSHIPVRRRDEIGLLEHAFNKMVRGLKGFSREAEDILNRGSGEPSLEIEGELKQVLVSMADQSAKKHAAENDLIRSRAVLDGLPILVMVADPNLNIQFINSTGERVFQELQDYIGLSPDRILGQSIEIFHENPEGVREIVSDPQNLPYRTEIRLGAETFEVEVHALYGEDGDYLGPLVTWRVVGERRNGEDRGASLAEGDQPETGFIRPRVDRLAAVIGAAAQGDLSGEIPVAGADSLGRLGRELEQFFFQLRKRILSLGQTAEALVFSSGQLTSLSDQVVHDVGETTTRACLVQEISKKAGSDQVTGFRTKTRSAKIPEFGPSLSGLVQTTRHATKSANALRHAAGELTEIAAELQNLLGRFKLQG